MKLIKTIIKFTFVMTTAYRGKMFIWFLAGIITPLVGMSIWYTSINDNSSLTLSYTVTYYFLVIIANQLFFPHILAGIERKIQTGKLNAFLLKPLGLLKYYIIHESSWKIIEFSLSLPFIIIFYLIFRDYISISDNQFIVIWAISSFIVGYLINFFFQYIIASFSFWIYKSSAITKTTNVLYGLSSGRWIPLGILPETLRYILKFLPFSYSLFLPISILIGNKPIETLARETGYQLIWLFLLYIIYRILWSRGIRKYEAVGI